MKISALILTKNEEDMLDDCLKQLDFVDEIIVLDQNSNDRTVKIARKYTKNILNSDKSDFAFNRDILAREAKGDWLLYVDSDERYSKQLKAEITNSINDSNTAAFYISRKNIVLGRWMKHGGFWPDYVPKLFYKNSFKHWRGPVHESPIYSGSSKQLKNPIKHMSARSISQMLSKTIKWAQIEAQLAYKANHPKVNIIKVVKTFIVELFYRYIYKLGILDGTIGLIQSLFQSYHKSIYLVYLWELQTDSKDKINHIHNV